MAKTKVNTENTETIDLSSVLSREVKVDAPQAIIIEETAPIEFEETTFQEQTIENDNRPPLEAGYGARDDDYDAPGYENIMSPTDVAETIVNLLDGLQSSIIPALREKKIFTEKELEQLAKIDKTANYDSNTKEFAVLQKWKRHQDIIKQIPFDEGESRRLKIATANYAETTNMRVTPLQGLIMAYSEVALKRIPMFLTD